MNTNKKLDNKGFSLVELIIVIAIMAILVGVVGTQVIPYIEKSRQSKDLQILSGYCTNLTSAAANCAGVIDATADYTITINGTGATCTVSPSTAVGSTDLLNNFLELAGYTQASDFTLAAAKFESKAAKATGVGPIVCTLTQSNSNPAQNGVVVELQNQSKISKVSSK